MAQPQAKKAKMMDNSKGHTGEPMTTNEDVDGDRDSARQGLIGLNNLNYRLEPDMSVAVHCTDKNHFFQQQTYVQSQRAVCVLNSGADYIDPRRSFLCFTVELPNDDAFAYGYNEGDLAERITWGRSNQNVHADSDGIDTNNNNAGSALNIIDRITISTRSGDELSRIERLNLLQYTLTPWTKDQQWIDTVGKGMGMGRHFTCNSVARNLETGGLEMRVAIPMYCLSGLFNYDRLLPSMLMSGLRIEIQWASPTAAFCREPAQSRVRAEDFGIARLSGHQLLIDPVVTTVATGNLPTESTTVTAGRGLTEAAANALVAARTIPGYIVKDIYFQLKSVQLTDSIQRLLNETSAVNGLEVVYTDYNNTQQVLPDTSGNFFMEVRHAASRALKAIMIPRPQGSVNNPLCDSFATTAMPFRRWHWRLGSLYFPHQQITEKTTIKNIPQTYTYTLDSFGKVAAAPRCAAKMDNYITPADHYLTFGGMAGYTVPGAPADISFPLEDPDDPASRATRTTRIELDKHDRPTAVINKQYWNNHLCNAPIGVSLERSTLFNLSGIPINNSRVLSFHGEFGSPTLGAETTNLGPTTYDCFLQYVRLARVFLNNVEVEQ